MRKACIVPKKVSHFFPQEIITVNKKSSRLAGLGCLFRKQKSCKTHWHMPCFRFIIGSSKCFLWTFARTFSNSSFGSSCDQLPTMNHATLNSVLQCSKPLNAKWMIIIRCQPTTYSAYSNVVQ